SRLRCGAAPAPRRAAPETAAGAAARRSARRSRAAADADPSARLPRTGSRSDRWRPTAAHPARHAARRSCRQLLAPQGADDLETPLYAPLGHAELLGDRPRALPLED